MAARYACVSLFKKKKKALVARTDVKARNLEVRAAGFK